ncbi:MAG TPA: tetratricopeptide repeat protein [Alphaproteobacteria bacterium]|nr:tetratricopeptide repeat protein [Alphaproteobacteria bacterium]
MDDTASITAVDASVPRVGPSWAVAVMAAVGGVALLAMGGPRLIAATMTVEARSVIWDVYEGTPVPQDRLLAAAADVAAAARWARDGELEASGGLLLLRAAEGAPEPRQAELRTAAVAALESALSVAPGQPNAWFNLAHLRRLRGDPAGAVAALRMSLLAGRFVPGLMQSRIALGVALLPAMDRETLDLLHREIRLMWVAEPHYVAELGASPAAGPVVRAALDGLTEAEMAEYRRRHGR